MADVTRNQWKTIHPRAGNLVKTDGTLINEADYLDRTYSNLSSFDEINTVTAKTQIDLKSVYPFSIVRDKQTSESGDGTVTQQNGYFKVSTTSAANSDITFQSVEIGRYVAGFDALAGIAAALAVLPIGNQEIEFGYTDFVNGFVIGRDSTGMYMAYYSAGVRSTKYYRNTDWTNPLDGSDGNWTFNEQNLNVYRLPFRWYGKGPFELKLLGLDLDGRGRTFFANSTPPASADTDAPITENPNLPISVRIKNNGTSGNPIDVHIAGRQFHILGDYDPDPRTSSEYRLTQSIGTDFVPLIAFKHRTDGIGFDSISTKLSGMDISPTNSIIYQFRIAPDFSGDANASQFLSPSLSSSLGGSGNESATLFNTQLTTTLTDGLKIYEGLAVGGQGNSENQKTTALPAYGLPADGTPIVLCARAVGTGSDVTTVLRVEEEW